MTCPEEPQRARRYWTRPMCLDDALLPAVARDRLGLDGRWPEPRALDQADVFFLLDRTRVDVADLGQVECCWLLELLFRLVVPLHEQAACDDESTTSSALEWALDELGVLPVHAFGPAVWLESIGLVRALRVRVGR